MLSYDKKHHIYIKFKGNKIMVTKRRPYVTLYLEIMRINILVYDSLVFLCAYLLK